MLKGLEVAGVIPVVLEQRLHRAGKLCALRNSGVPAAEAWRTVKPDTTANDRAAAEQARREIRWYHVQLERLYGKLCPGVAGRPCEKRVASARHTYCAACGAERHRLQRQKHNRNYYRLNREDLREDRRRRRRKARAREAAETLAASWREAAEMLAASWRAADEERRAEAAAADAARNEPPKMVDKNGKLVAAFNPETQKWEYTDQNRRRIGRW